MTINFEYPITTTVTAYPTKFLGRDGTGTWNVITYYVAANDDSIDTGWAFQEVDNYGITRADIEDLSPDPTPFIYNVTESVSVTLGVYGDSSIVLEVSDPEALPFGEIGRVALTYTTAAGKIISAVVDSILPERD